MKDPSRVKPPGVSRARSGDVAMAYQVVGSGPVDMVFVRGIPDAWHVYGLAPG